jgi:hypothetical protein
MDIQVRVKEIIERAIESLLTEENYEKHCSIPLLECKLQKIQNMHSLEDSLLKLKIESQVEAEPISINDLAEKVKKYQEKDKKINSIAVVISTAENEYVTTDARFLNQAGTSISGCIDISISKLPIILTIEGDNITASISGQPEQILFKVRNDIF